MATVKKNRCPHCGKEVLGKPANNRNVRCEYCWGVLEMTLEEAGLDTDGNPVQKGEPVVEPSPKPAETKK